MPNDPGQDARSTQIERTINRDVADALTMSPHGGSVFTVAPRSMGELLEFAKLMSVSGICIRPMFRGNPGACLALTLQAMKWGADPFAVANKAFEVNGQLSYESQMIHAIVNSSPALAQRLNATFSGDGVTRQCLVTGVIKGESEAREYQSPKLSEITPKNSPLWKTDPDQQLFYYSTRAWARRWVPEVLLGIYTPDEIGRTIEMVPAEEPQRKDFADQKQADIEALADDRPVNIVIDLDGVEHEFREEATAETALMRVLTEAAKQGLERLVGAWESNGSTGTPRVIEHYETLRRSASPAKPAAAPRGRPRNPEPAAVAEIPSGQRSMTPEPKPPEAVEGAGSSSETNARQSAPAAARLADPVSQQSSGQTRLDAEGTGGSPAPKPWPLDPPEPYEGNPLGDGRQGEEWRAPPQPDEADDPDRGSLAIVPPIRRGQPDWRTWTIALFLPKVRQAKTTSDLAFLVGDNDDNLTKAKAALDREDRATLEEAIARRFQEVENA